MIGKLVARFAAGLRVPVLFALCGLLFLADLLVPDFIPFADEILLALLTVAVGAFRKRRQPTPSAPPPPAQPS